MAAIDYTHMGGAGSDSRFVRATTPADVLTGEFVVHYIPDHAHDYWPSGTVLYLLSSETAAYQLAYTLRVGGGGTVYFDVILDAATTVVLRDFTYSAGARLSFTVNSRVGSVTVAGADLNDGTTTGARWFVDDGAEFGIGCSALGAETADGHVSLPYAVDGAAPASVKSLDFSVATNSAHFLTAGL